MKIISNKFQTINKYSNPIKKITNPNSISQIYFSQNHKSYGLQIKLSVMQILSSLNTHSFVNPIPHDLFRLSVYTCRGKFYPQVRSPVS